jgi:hypothetical protein
VATLPWNQWQLCCGISGNFRVESAATFAWNQWQLCRGISGNFRVEYADASEAQVESAQVAVAAGEAEVAHWEQVRDTYRGHLEAMSWSVHPWRVKDSMPQSSQEVEAQLADEVAALQELLENHELAVKQKVLDKVRKQLADLAAVIDVWWQTVRQIVLAGKQGRCA